MKAAIVAEWYPSPGDPVHGLWAHRQAVAAAAEGVETIVLALRRPVPPLSVARKLAQLPPDVRAFKKLGRDARRSLRVAELDGITIESVPWIGPPRPISYGSWGYWMAPTLVRALDRLYSRWRFDLLHAHCLAPAGHAAALWMRSRGARVGDRPGDRPAFAVSAHGPDMFDVPERSSVGRHACIVALDTADLVVANSGWTRQRCQEIASHPLPATVVHLGADVPSAAPGGRLGNRDERHELALVTIAHLQARKHHATVLRALALLGPEIRPTYLVIGDGEEREALERLGAPAGARRSRPLHGPATQRAGAERTGWVRRVRDAGNSRTLWGGVRRGDGRGSAGDRRSRRGRTAGHRRGGGGDVARHPGDANELAETLRGLDRDRDELRRLGAAGRATVEAHFTWEACGERTVAAYRDALRNRDAARIAHLAA